MITLGVLLKLEIGAVGLGDAACIGDMAGAALGSNVESTTGTASVGLGTALGCATAVGNPVGSAEELGVAVGTSDLIGKSSSDGSEVELMGLCDNEGMMNTLGAAVVGKALESVGEIPLGKLLKLEIGTVGPVDAASVDAIVGSTLDTGFNVEPPTETVGIGGKLGC